MRDETGMKSNVAAGLRKLTERPSNVEIERGLETLGRVMDNQFQIPIIGWRFGLDSIVGLIPGVGDTATSAVSLYILAAAARYRVPKITMLRMAANIGLDFTLGSLPVVGDLFDAWWKSNTRNIRLIRERATAAPDEVRRGRVTDWLFIGVLMLILVGLLVGSLALVYLALRFMVNLLGLA